MTQKLYTVFKGKVADANFIKLFLEDNNIIPIIKNIVDSENNLSWEIKKSFSTDIEIQVEAKDVERAIKLIDDFQKS